MLAEHKKKTQADENQLLISAPGRGKVQDGGNFPIFYLKENAAVEFGIASAATLEIILGPEADDTPCGDLDGDGIVGGADLTKLLGGWNSNDPELDLTGDGFVGGADLTVLLGCWTSS